MRTPFIWPALLLLLAATGARGGPGVDYLQRLSRLDRDDPGAVAALADWARERDLKQPAAELYRRVVELTPGDDRAYERLVQLRSTTRLPEDEDRQAKLLETFEGFSLHVAPHFVVVYDTERAWALNRAVLLEKTHHIFYAALRRAGLRPLPLERRLVCVLFAEHEDFTRYAKRVDGADMSWSGGYYSSRTNRIAFYHDRTNPAFRQMSQHMAALERRIGELDERITEATRRSSTALLATFRRERREARRQFNWYRNRRDAVAGAGNAIKTTHEAAHQLAFNSELQSRRVLYPFWLSEGLASSFETPDPSADYGPYHPNPPRRAALIDARRHDLLLPLDELLVLRRPAADDADRAAALYAQAWGLFHFLFTRRHEQMRDYLRTLAGAPPGPRDQAALRQAFEDAFGSIPDLQKQWDRHLRLLR